MSPTPFLSDAIKTPLGLLRLAVDAAHRLKVVDWHDHEDRMNRVMARYYGAGSFRLVPTRDPGGVSSALAAYFEGEIAAIDALAVDPRGTAFQMRVWRALRAIPAGATWSYGDLARHIGQPKAVRAVGLANGANPIGVVVPCHRVIGASGALTGYGGGLHRKEWLLRHEGARFLGDLFTAL